MKTAAHRNTAALATPLTLFETTPSTQVPERFRIDEATKRRGLKHIARIKAQLEARHPSPAARGGRPRPGIGERAA